MPNPDPRPWQRMLSGKRLNLEEPLWTDVEIEDIAHGLSRVARWNGQTIGDWAFSVAQHSLVVERLCVASAPAADARLRLLALLHDAPEYVIGDLISPFKALMGEGYKATENRILDAVLTRFGLAGAATRSAMKAIKRADQASAYLEAVELAGFEAEIAARYFKPQPWALHAFETGAVSLEPMRPEEAKSAFLTRFHELAAAATAAQPRRRANGA
ncbi:MAG: hydrolase [Pseudomonadota bacterium]